MINIDKYRVAANITEYQIVSKLFFLRIIHDDKAIMSCKNGYTIFKKLTCVIWTYGFLARIIELLRFLHSTLLF